jgi:hypothetical protein
VSRSRWRPKYNPRWKCGKPACPCRDCIGARLLRKEPLPDISRYEVEPEAELGEWELFGTRSDWLHHERTLGDRCAELLEQDV